MSNISRVIWTTKEGVRIPIKEMTTSHLLSTIHFIERNRMNALLEIGLSSKEVSEDTINFYAKFPPEYEALCDEAEKRFLIKRGTQKAGLIKKRKK